MRRATIIIATAAQMLLLSGCSSYLAHAWEGTKTCMRHVARASGSLFGGKGESRIVSSNQEFYGSSDYDFVPLLDADMQTQVVDYVAPQAKEVPGAPNSKIPSIAAFSDPSHNLASIFHKIYFNTDQHVPKTKEGFQQLTKIAAYLKRHKNTYIFVAGHCDERASEAYNLSLGTKRAGFIRNFLIKQGVSPEQVFTISYGKEKPEVLGHNPAAWAQNRRATFKIYQKGASI